MRYILNAHFEFATAQPDSNRVTMLSVPEEITTPDTTSDLRQVGAHPNHWYPVAWSREIKSGKTFATSFGGEPVEGRRLWLHRALLLSRLELRCIGPVR